MPPGRFDPDVAMQLIEREQVTAIGGVPTVMWRILESPNLPNFDLSSVKRASYGGAPAAPELVERIEEVFPNLRKTLTTAYGLTRPRRSRPRTEATTTSRTPARSAGPRRRSSCASSTSTVTTPRRASAARCGSRARP